MNVKGTDAAQVDNFGLDPLLGELVRGFHAVGHHLAVGDNGDVRALALNFGLPDWEKEVVGHGFRGHGERYAVEHFIFEEYDRRGIADCGLVRRNFGHLAMEDTRVRETYAYFEKTLAVLSTPWAYDFEAGHLAVPGRVILGVLRGDPSGRTVRTAEDDWTWHISAGHVVCLAARVDNLVDGLGWLRVNRLLEETAGIRTCIAKLKVINSHLAQEAVS